MNNDSKRFTVGLELTYTVEAESADAALRAVLPMVRDAETVAYTVREQLSQPPVLDRSSVKPYADLSKCVYKVHEVAAILGISRNAVYERVPCIRVGSRRLYPRATILDILQHGLQQKTQSIKLPQRPFRSKPVQKPARVIAKADKESEKPLEPPRVLTMKDAATMLRLSYSKTKELFDTRKIYCAESHGKRIVLRDAVEHYLAGGTALEYAERLIERAENDAHYKDEPELVEKFAREMRDRWSP